MIPSSSPHAARPLLPYVLPWLALLVFLAITHMLWQYEHNIVVKELQTNFNFRVLDARYRIDQRIKIYEQLLHGAEGLFNHSDTVTRNEFRDYVAKLNLIEDYPGVQGLGFALQVPKGEKDRHIAEMRSQGYPEYTISPPGERDLYTPVFYIAPYNEMNQRTLGYDMYSDREFPQEGDIRPGLRRLAMEKARDTGKAIISDMTRVKTDSELDIQANIVMLIAVYKYGSSHDNIAERRANIIGWVYAPIRVSELMAELFGEHATEVDIEIYNGKEPALAAMMYDSDNIPRSHLTAADARFQATRRLNFYGQDWTMVIHSLPSFDALEDSEKPKLVAIGGIGISILLALLTWLYIYDRERTHNLLRQNRYLSMRMFEVLEDERRNLARELHDEIGQWLTAIQFQVKTISKLTESTSPVQTSVRIINESATEMHEALHKIVHNLRPSRLDALGLVESLSRLVHEWCDHHHGMTNCEFAPEGELGDLSDNLNITLYRLVQESLNNAGKHAHATMISIKLSRVQHAHSGADAILLSIEDNGVGFDPNQPTKGVGLIGMRERVVAAEGKFDMYSEPGRGLLIQCELPLHAEAAGEEPAGLRTASGAAPTWGGTP